MRKPLNGRIGSEIKMRSIMITLLNYLVSNKEEIKNNRLMELYLKIDSLLSSFDVKLKGVNAGKFREFAEKTKVLDLMNSLKVFEEKRNIRTIHGSKGDEFDSVLLCLEKESSLKHIMTPDMSNEECRIIYVALSRAKNHLYVSVPKLSQDDGIFLEKMGIELIKLDVSQSDSVSSSRMYPKGRIKTLFDY
jgi:DNA helicase-2/ATP-dependent DNA helicase PcrA